jgi:hypothetical protein
MFSGPDDGFAITVDNDSSKDNEWSRNKKGNWICIVWQEQHDPHCILPIVHSMAFCLYNTDSVNTDEEQLYSTA